MSIGMGGSTDPTVLAQTRAFVVYDTATGEILHVHRSVTFPENPPGGPEPEARARRLAGANADVVEVDPDEINHRRPVRVDIATRRVVAADG
jgi:hypothetical protein